MNNDYPCGNTQTEIDRDQPIVRTLEEWELRHEERQRKLDSRKEFIATLLRNEPAYTIKFIDSDGKEFRNAYFLHDAIGCISDENFWSFVSSDHDLPLDYLNIDDPEQISELFVAGKLNQFKSLIQHEVEKLSDIVKF